MQGLRWQPLEVWWWREPTNVENILRMNVERENLFDVSVVNDGNLGWTNSMDVLVIMPREIVFIAPGKCAKAVHLDKILNTPCSDLQNAYTWESIGLVGFDRYRMMNVPCYCLGRLPRIIESERRRIALHIGVKGTEQTCMTICSPIRNGPRERA